MRKALVLVALAATALAQGLVLTHLWSATRVALPLAVAVSEEGSVLVADTAMGRGGSAVLFSPDGLAVASFFYAEGVGSADYRNGTFAFVTLGGRAVFLSPEGDVLRTVRVSPDAALGIALGPSGFVVCRSACEAYSGSQLVWRAEVSSAGKPAWGRYVYVPTPWGVEALDPETGERLFTVAPGPAKAVAACGDAVAVASDKVRIYSVAKGFPQLVGEADLRAEDLAFYEDCNVLLAATGKGLAALDRNGRVLSTAEVGPAVRVSWAGDYVAVAAFDGAETVSLYKALLPHGTPKARYALNFREVGAEAVTPLTYPSPNGTVFVLARSGGALEVWTLLNGTIIGKVEVPPDFGVIPDTRTGQAALLGERLLAVFNGTLYAIYGNETEALMRLSAQSPYSRFLKIGDEIYAVSVNVTAKNATCTFTALGGGSRSYSLPVGERAMIVVDFLDAKGCAAIWSEGPGEVSYSYSADAGKGTGKLRCAGAVSLSALFAEVGEGESRPYVYCFKPGIGSEGEVLLYDMAGGRALKAPTPPRALPVATNVGDYLGEGYYGDVATLIADGNKYSLVVLSTSNITQRFDFGEVGRTFVYVSGLALHEGYVKNVVGLGNLTGLEIDVSTNVGTLKFAIRGVTLLPSWMSVLLTLTEGKMCYTAALNPLGAGRAYLATACLPR
ncbi:MAG: hypothetical protein GXO07_03270 [Crenarchaeota archaeon]|nr:hypothetical protein [Thermoproteota archaeon]